MSLDLFRKVVPPFIVKAYRNNMARRLAAYGKFSVFSFISTVVLKIVIELYIQSGVHFDDLLVEEVDVKVAVSRMPEDQLIARYVRSG